MAPSGSIGQLQQEGRTMQDYAEQFSRDYDYDSAQDGWADAFDLCREMDRPINVRVDGVCYKLFPSGHCKNLETGAINA